MTTTASTQAVEQLRDRIRLYLQVMLIFDLAAYVSDLVAPLFIEDLSYPQVPLLTRLVRWTVTLGLAAGWAFAKFARPARSTLIVLEGTLTLALVCAYAHIALNVSGPELAENAPLFGLFGITLLLVVRSSFVPSPAGRTAVIGIASLLCLYAIERDQIHAAHPQLQDALSFLGGAIVLMTAFTSHVIYGLRRQVRHAMRLGQYELGRKLGEGGMGVVYEATHVMLRRPTAVKLLPIEKAGEQTILRFEREVQQTSRLEHPNSVSIYDYGRTPDGQFYYAMEYLDGMTLEELVRLEGPLPQARAALILRQAAEALAEAHARGLVHRDIKPANIMVCERAQIPDTVKVLDFGLVKSIDNANSDADNNLTHANTILGTPHYLAPEAIADPDEVGAPSDVYALGAVGFFLLTGRQVFAGRSVVEVCAKHLETEPESPSSVLERPIDPGLERLVLRCLAKQPDDRPADGAALAQELQRLDLAGWTLDDAREWWRKHPRGERGTPEGTPPERTQLTIDIEGRG